MGCLLLTVSQAPEEDLVGSDDGMMTEAKQALHFLVQAVTEEACVLFLVSLTKS